MATRSQPERVQVHDFADRALGEFAKAISYGIYDVANNEGWVSVGDVADTAEFAVESIRRWWNQMGRIRFPVSDWLLITADAGGSNGYRLRAWKVHLARLAAETGLDSSPSATTCSVPCKLGETRSSTACSSFITMNWRGRPLTSVRTIIELISAHHHRDRPHRASRLRPGVVRQGHQDRRSPNSPPCPSPPTTSTANWNYTINAHTDLS